MSEAKSMFGLLNIHKPVDWTSRDVVNHVSRLLPRKTKCGHAGTLDPLATGVLLICIGKATQLVPYIHDHAKSYEGTFLLGQTSETDDTEGELTAVPIPDDLNDDLIRKLLPAFTGEIAQVPPAYSAIKVNGERAYKAARRGDDVDIPPRRVRIDELLLTQFDGKSMTLEMTCGTGTYVRSLGRDIARRLGTEAVMSALIRMSIGPFHVTDAVPLDVLTRENISGYVQSPLVGLPHLRQFSATDDEVRRLSFGQRVVMRSEDGQTYDDRMTVVVTGPSREIAAIAKVENRRLAPQIVFPLSE